MKSNYFKNNNFSSSNKLVWQIICYIYISRRWMYYRIAHTKISCTPPFVIADSSWTQFYGTHTNYRHNILLAGLHNTFIYFTTMLNWLSQLVWIMALNTFDCMDKVKTSNRLCIVSNFHEIGDICTHPCDGVWSRSSGNHNHFMAPFV